MVVGGFGYKCDCDGAQHDQDGLDLRPAFAGSSFGQASIPMALGSSRDTVCSVSLSTDTHSSAGQGFYGSGLLLERGAPANDARRIENGA